MTRQEVLEEIRATLGDDAGRLAATLTDQQLAELGDSMLEAKRVGGQFGRALAEAAQRHLEAYWQDCFGSQRSTDSERQGG